MNYDFKANWNDIVLPLLSHPSVKKSIKKGITSFIKDGQSYEDTYDGNKCPASYSSNDGWDNYMDRFKEQLTDRFIETGIIDEPPEIEDDDYECPEYLTYKEKRDKCLEHFIKHHEKTCLRAYQMFGACHWWNPTFCFTLAKIIYPRIKWKILKGQYHTTIVSEDNKMVFDILYFDEEDDFKGGNHAINEATRLAP